MFKIKDIKVSKIDYKPPLDFFEKFSKYKYNSLLHSQNLSIIGYIPYMRLEYDGDLFKLIHENEEMHLKGNPKEVLKELTSKLNFNKFPLNNIGLIGYFSYDLKDKIENFNNSNKSNYIMPLIEQVLYNEYFIFFNKERIAYKCELQFEKESKIFKLSDFSEGILATNFLQENSKDEYLKKIDKIKNYIFEGDIYEVNFTQQIEADFKGNPYEIFKKLYKINPAPYSAFLNFSSTIISNSPELFLEVNAKKVITKPIKGTIARGKTAKQDKQNKMILSNSEKDRAELNMIIDLLRNDLGKVCHYGSVKVNSKGHIETFENVYHLVGEVEGILKNDIIDLLFASFPGGSITGCPKIRAMEIINEMEKYRRNIYTGSIMMINKDNLLSNIVIRTLILDNGKLYFNAGGAITIDSDPVSEYNEYKAKLTSIAKVLNYDGIF